MLRSFLASALLAGLVLAAPAGAVPAEQGALRAASFTDAAGDSGGAPDITSVDVGNDVVAGPIVLWIETPNRPDDLGDGDALAVGLNVDRNAATGDELGAEYWLFVDAESAFVLAWDGTDYVDVDAPSLRASFVKSVRSHRISIHPNELGGVTAFDFYVSSLNGEDYDLAPNGAPAWSYTLASGRPPLFVLGLLLNPKAPAAGKALTVTMGVGRGDTFDLLDQGKVTCTLLVGGKPLKAARAGFAQGLPQCRWNLPKAAKGKALKGTMSIAFGGSTAKKSFSSRAK